MTIVAVFVVLIVGVLVGMLVMAMAVASTRRAVLPWWCAEHDRSLDVCHMHATDAWGDVLFTNCDPYVWGVDE